jgi:5-enolpyruvylshikimate-3-phosphate synthase
MNPVLENMEAKLKLWRQKIDHLEAKSLKPVSFDAVMYIDELRVLLAVAQLSFDQSRANGNAKRTDLEAEMTDAWSDLEDAFKKPIP